MTRRHVAELLRQMPLFEECSPADIDRVAALTVETTLRPGTILTHEGQVGGLVYVILDGQAEVSSGGQAIGTVGSGDLVGELSLLDGQPRSAQVKAAGELKVLEINSDDFATLMKKNPGFVQVLMRAVSTRLRRANEHQP